MLPVYILLFIILAAIGYLLYRQSQQKPAEIDLDKALNTLIKYNQDNLSKEKQIISTDLSAKKEAIEKLVQRVLDQLSTVERDSIKHFSSLNSQLEQQKAVTESLAATTEGLKKTLSNNQLRGAFGEKVAEDLLKMSGFVIGTDYTKQESSQGTRPDFTLYLPDRTKINIDSKFPYSNIIKMTESDDPSEKSRHLKLFEQDIKKKIQEVTTRDYISPADGTVDFVVLFIPNEMVFSFIYEKFPDLLEEAVSKKIVFAGPFSFTAILRMVRQAYENFRFQKNIQGIISQIRVFSSEFDKYNEEFVKIGERIDSLHKQYDSVNSTRTNKLLRSIDKIKLEDSSEQLTALHD